MEKNSDELTLELHCRNLPGIQWKEKSGIRLGIQKGKEVIDDVPANMEEIIFSVPVRIKGYGLSEDPDFSGAFVHGKIGDRFFYFCWGERVGGGWDQIARAKLPYRYLEKQKIAVALETAKPIRAVIDMTSKRGGPLCATIPVDHIEWHIS